MLKGIFWIVVGILLAKYVFLPIMGTSLKNLSGTDWKAVIDKLLKR